MRNYKQIRLITVTKDEDTKELNELLRKGYEIKEKFSLIGGYKFLLEKTTTAGTIHANQ